MQEKLNQATKRATNRLADKLNQPTRKPTNPPNPLYTCARSAPRLQTVLETNQVANQPDNYSTPPHTATQDPPTHRPTRPPTHPATQDPPTHPSNQPQTGHPPNFQCLDDWKSCCSSPGLSRVWVKNKGPPKGQQCPFGVQQKHPPPPKKKGTLQKPLRIRHAIFWGSPILFAKHRDSEVPLNWIRARLKNWEAPNEWGSLGVKQQYEQFGSQRYCCQLTTASNCVLLRQGYGTRTQFLPSCLPARTLQGNKFDATRALQLELPADMHKSRLGGSCQMLLHSMLHRRCNCYDLGVNIVNPKNWWLT